jgi:hypothetical protein
MRQIIGLFDEYQSRENGKHVRKAMIENAHQGFYNGSPVALGYKAVEVEKRGIRIKKKLAIDPVEAETVRLIFRLYREGDGISGPLGVKKVASWLNERGYRTRRGARFSVIDGLSWIFDLEDQRSQSNENPSVLGSASQYEPRSIDRADQRYRPPCRGGRRVSGHMRSFPFVAANRPNRYSDRNGGWESRVLRPCP